MRAFSYTMASAAFVLGGVALAFAVQERRAARTRRPAASRATALQAALVASIIAVLVLTLYPIDDDKKLELVPFSDVIDAVTPPVDLARLLVNAANVLLFVPLGAILGELGLGLRKTIVVGLALSVTVELLQLLLVPGRTTALDDVLLNTLGAAVGQTLLCRYAPRVAAATASESG